MKYFIFSCAFIFLLGISSLAYPRATVQTGQATPVTFECIKAASEKYDVPIAVLFAILDVEGGKPGEACRNKNGSWDMGPFQINSWWAKTLTKADIDPFVVLNNGCVNAAFASWILRQEMNRGNDLWQAVARYHSPTPYYQRKYLARIKRSLRSLNVKEILKKTNGF